MVRRGHEVTSVHVHDETPTGQRGFVVPLTP